MSWQVPIFGVYNWPLNKADPSDYSSDPINISVNPLGPMCNGE